MSDAWWARHRRLRRLLYWLLPPGPFATDPYELAFGAMFTVYGTISLIFGSEATPDSFDDTQPRWVLALWAACFLLGGASMTLGRWRQWLHVEAAGLVAASAPLAFYAVVVWQGFGVSGLLTILNLSTITTANALRWRVVRKGLAALEAAREEVARRARPR